IDRVTSIAVDSAGNACVTGLTNSDDFPVGSGFQMAFGGLQDAFVTKLSPTGNTLAYSSYLGGNGADQGWGITVDTAGNAYVTGRTASPDFPTVNPFQSVRHGFQDAFVIKVSAAGTTVAYSTYVGGTEVEI